MGQSRLNTEPRAVRVALSCAALAFVAGAAFGLALLSTTSDVVTVSNAAAVPPDTRAGRDASATFATLPYATATVPGTPNPATATAGSAQATETAQAAPRFVLDYRATGSNRTDLFTISGHAWKVDLHCSTPSEGLGTSATDVTVRAGIPNGGFTADRLGYQCPPGPPGDTNAGTASATYRDTGVFYLYVDSGTNASVEWEVIVTDIP